MLQINITEITNTAIPSGLSMKNRIPSFVVSNFLLLLIIDESAYIIPILMLITYFLHQKIQISKFFWWLRIAVSLACVDIYTK